MKCRGRLAWRRDATARRALLAIALVSTALIARAAAPESSRRDGATVYQSHCSVCHGENGDGRSRARASLVPPPRDFTDAAIAARLTREYMIAIVREGRPGTAMVGWSRQLGLAETEAVVDYVRNTFMRPALDPKLARGRIVYGHECARCHGIRGEGLSGGGKAVTAFKALQPPLTTERIVAGLRRGPHAERPSRLPDSDRDAVARYVASVLADAAPALSGASAYGTPARGDKKLASDR